MPILVTLSRASPLSSGESAGGTFISLRNLGAARTLVLLNGRRLGITGTPSYILADDVVVGAVGFQQLKSRIDNVRKCGKSECNG